MNSDLISRSELKKHKFTTQQANGAEIEDIEFVPLACIDNAPIVTPTVNEVAVAEKTLDSQWIPITYRPLTVKERIAFAEHYGVEYCDTAEEKAFDCPMPEDGQEILVSSSRGVCADVAYNDTDGDGFTTYELYSNGDWEGIDAWMPLPAPYKKEGEEE